MWGVPPSPEWGSLSASLAFATGQCGCSLTNSTDFSREAGNLDIDIESSHFGKWTANSTYFSEHCRLTLRGPSETCLLTAPCQPLVWTIQHARQEAVCYLKDRRGTVARVLARLPFPEEMLLFPWPGLKGPSGPLLRCLLSLCCRMAAIGHTCPEARFILLLCRWASRKDLT